MNIDEKYSVALDLFEKYRRGTIIQNSNMLFDIHYSKLLSYLGFIRIDQGALSEGIEHLCQATLRGLSYNRYIFHERVEDVLVAIKKLIEINKISEARVACEKFIAYWEEQKSIDKDCEIEVRKALDIAEKQLQEIDLVSRK